MKKFMIIVLCFGICLVMCETYSWGACGGVTSTGNVQGKNSNWTYIGTVAKYSQIRIQASGKVDFGCKLCGCVDGPTAGVEGKTQSIKSALNNLKKQITTMPKILDPLQEAKSKYNAIKNIFGAPQKPNYDQGGVWIKVVTKSGAPWIAPQLYYFWEHGDGINTYGLPVFEDVNVYAKAHDGGKSPDETKGYGDNKGAYNVTIKSSPLNLGGISVSGDPTDNDGDGIPDAIENELAKKFAPEVRLTPTNKSWTLPASVDWYLSRVSMRFNHTHGFCKDCEVIAKGKLTQANMHRIAHPTIEGSIQAEKPKSIQSATPPQYICKHTNDQKYSNNSSYFYLEPNSDDVHKGSSYPSDWRAYVHVKRAKSGGFFIQYWFFYPYNNYYDIIIHEGDWEHITVRLDANGNPVKAYYAAHSEGTTHDWGKLQKVGGTHPVVYSARGSHASYPTAGSHKIKGLPLGIPANDDTYNGGLVWQTWDNLVNIGEKGRPLNGQEFILYSGRWGKFGQTNDTSGPIGPAFKSDFDDENK
jgi:hypothetical protein